MNELEIFNYESTQIRTTTIDGAIYFAAKQVAEVLGYKKPRNAVATHCKGALKRGVPHPQSKIKEIQITFIPEGDLYRLIIKSNYLLLKSSKGGSWMKYSRQSERTVHT